MKFFINNFAFKAVKANQTWPCLKSGRSWAMDLLWWVSDTNGSGGRCGSGSGRCSHSQTVPCHLIVPLLL